MKSKAQKQKELQQRQAHKAALSLSDQLRILNMRVGLGEGAAKERARLLGKMMANPTRGL